MQAPSHEERNMKNRLCIAVSLVAILAAFSPTGAAFGTTGAQGVPFFVMAPGHPGPSAAGTGPLQCLCPLDLRNLVAAWLAGGRFELQRALEEVKAEGVKMSLADIGSPPVPDEENAAPIYRKAWDALQGPPPEVLDAAGSLRKTPIALWPKDKKRTLADYVASQRDAIGLTLKATRYEKCNFGLDFSQGFAMLMPHLAQMRSLARLMSVDATDKLGRGDIEGAIESDVAMRVIAKHVGSDPTLIGKLVEIACDGMAGPVLESILKLGYPDAAQLKGLLRRLDQVPPDTSMRAAFSAETTCGIDTYHQVRICKMSPSEMADYASSPSGGPKSDTARAIVTVLWGLIADRDEAAYLDTMRRYIELSDKPYYEVKTAIEDEKPEQSFGLMSRTITPALLPAFAVASRAEAEYQVQRLSVALMIFEQDEGSFPSALDQLVPGVIPEVPVDPFSGKPYVYRNNDGRFVVYSLDQNMVDDNGMSSTEVGRDKGDIVFSFTAKP
jgi:hypothetical protein